VARKKAAARPKKEKDRSERWLLTYADMITLLLLFFIILYSISTVNPAKFEAVSQAFANVFNGGPFALFDTRSAGGAGILEGLTPGQQVKSSRGGPQAGTGGASQLRTQAVSALQNLVKAGKVKVIPTENGFAISLVSDTYFGSASATLNPDAMPVLQQVAEFLGLISNSIVVEGYTDSLPVDTRFWPSNWHLSSARSLAVLQTLEDYGIPQERLSSAAYGETRPVQSNDTAEGRSFNRRVDIVVVEKQ
jgi:chemotaxis protein MotB